MYQKRSTVCTSPLPPTKKKLTVYLEQQQKTVPGFMSIFYRSDAIYQLQNTDQNESSGTIFEALD